MLKTLGRETKGFRLVSVLTPIFMIAEVIMEMIIPKLMASIIDNGVTPGNMQVIYTVGAQMVVAALFGLLFGVLGAVSGSHAATGFARNLRRSMFENIQTFSFANIDKYSTAGLVTRMTTDVTNIQNAYQMLLRMSIRAPASMIVALVMSYTINRQLANVYLIAVILLGGVLVFIMSRATKYFSEAFRKYDDLNESVQENVSAIRVVKAYVREKFESEKFQKASENVRNLLMRAELIIAWNAPFMQLTVYSCILLISWLGARLIVSSGATTFTTGDLMSMLSYCMNILMSLMMLSMVFVMITMSAASAKRVAEVLDEQSDLTNGENPVTEVKDGAVRFDHVSFAYKKDGKKALEDIDLADQVRRDHRHHRRHRLGQIEPCAAAAPPVRRDRGQRVHRRCRRAELRLGDAAQQRCHGAAEERAVQRHDRREPALGQPRRHRRRDRGRLQAGLRR